MPQANTVSNQIHAAVNRNVAASWDGLMERGFGRLFRGLVYAQIWEDPVVDMRALQLGPADNLVCIASGGCNMMSYLCAGPASITVVDLSPAHVALNKLKLAAARHVPDHARFYDMFGHANRASNIETFNRLLAPHLDAETLAYWNERTPFGRRKVMFRRGLYRHGALGRFIGAAHMITGLGRVDFRELLAARDLDEQQAFFDRQIAPLFEARAVRQLARSRASLFGLGIPPAQYEKLAADADGDIIAVLRERTRKLFCDFPIQENYFAWQAAFRGYAPDGNGPVPPYLEAANFEAVKANASRATVLNQSLTDVLATQPDASKQAYVLLDAQDWMTDSQLNALWGEITRTAAPGARAVFRTGGTEDILPRRVASDTLDQWRYDAEASQAGTRADRSAIYGGFHVYRLKECTDA
ncbi:DUF3419 family protein [Tropicimonas marinistellae]|uniref:DUF3419 family protein n=1 Tax=Tropicimonas marinistellae TaxID=1739787 RepID=UPI000832F15C|nr:DUF3419 family protein [Tropicimonas marinistellae]